MRRVHRDEAVAAALDDGVRVDEGIGLLEHRPAPLVHVDHAARPDARQERPPVVSTKWHVAML